MNSDEIKIVPYEGPTSAKLYIVGEAPGRREEEEGKPFVGGSGDLLIKTLLNHGVRRSEVRLANVMKVRPPNDDFTFFYEGKEPTPPLLHGIATLLDDIRQCKPNCVLVLGNQPFSALCNEWGITNWRGSLLWSEKAGCKVVACVHPAAVLRQWDHFPLFVFDVKRGIDESKMPDYVPEKITVKFLLDFADACLNLEELEKADLLSVDIETTRGDEELGTHPLITCIGFSTDSISATVLPFCRKDGTPIFTGEEEVELLRRIKRLLENGARKIAQNAQFDLAVLKVYYDIEVKNLWMDTMCAFHTVYPELPKALDVISSIFTKVPYYKYMSRLGSDISFWTYNGYDACVTFKAALELEKEMKDFGVSDFYFNSIHKLISVLMDMQIKGVKIDVSLQEQARQELTTRMSETQGKLNELCEGEINVNSPKQIGQLLYGKLGLPPRYSRKGKGTTVNEEALIDLSVKFPSPIFDLILELRGLGKTLNTYINAPLMDGRIHTSYNIGGRIVKDGIKSAPETGRISSSRSIVFMSGTNLQNIPYGVCRKMFIPDSGYTFVGVDLSQAEARVVAYRAGEERLIRIFEAGEDIHKWMAAWLFEIDYPNVTKEQRTFAKARVHSFNYGLTAYGLARVTGWAKQKCAIFIGRYFDMFPAIKMQQFEDLKTVERTKALVTPFGRKRIFFGRWGEELFKEIYAYVPQSTVGDYFNLGLVKIAEACTHLSYPVNPLLQIHDGAVWQVPTPQVEEFKAVVKERFNIPLTLKGRTFTIPCELSSGNNWEEMR